MGRGMRDEDEESGENVKRTLTTFRRPRGWGRDQVRCNTPHSKFSARSPIVPTCT